MYFRYKNNLTIFTSIFFITIIYGQNNDRETNNYQIKNDTIKNISEYIKKESIGGKLDFSKMLIGYGGKNQKENKYKAYLYSIVMWTYSVKDLGIIDRKEIIQLWEEIYKRKMTKDELSALDKGIKEE